MKPVSNDDRNSLQRLIKVAKNKTPQSGFVANFLLAWWDAKTYGAFDLRDLWHLDHDFIDDMINVIRIITLERSSPAALGYGEEFALIIENWRPHGASKE